MSERYTRTDREGRKYKPTPRGTWEPLTEQEMAAEETGGVQAFLAQGPRAALDLNDLMAQVNPLARMGSPEGYQPPLDRAAGNMAERGRQFEPLDRAQAGPSMAGQILLDPIDLAAGGLVKGGVGMAGRAVRGRMADRVQAQAQRGAAARAAQVGADGGLRSVGAAETTSGPRRIWNDLVDEYNRVTTEFTTPMELNDTQLAAIPVMARIGFQALPGQLRGSRLMLEGIKSDPLLRQAVEPELMANRQGLERAIKRGLGLPETTAFTDDALLSGAEDLLGPEFDAVREAVTQPVTLSAAGREIADPMLSSYQRRAMDTEGALSGSELMEIRSRLSRQASELFKKGEYNAGTDVVDVINEIDRAIEPQLGPELLERWRTAQGRWRFKVFLEAGQTLGSKGEINIRSAGTAAKKIFGKDFRGFSDPATGRRGNLTAETSEALDWVKVGQAFADNIGDSGTAGRTRSIQLLTSPVEYGKSAMIGRIIRRQADLRAAPAPEPTP